MSALLWVGLGGCLGAVARHLAVQLVQRGGHLPTHGATLVVNALGCLAIGVLLTLFVESDRFGERGRLLLVVGLLGSFTTFSTFGWETVELLRRGETLAALAHVGLHLVLGLALVGLGIGLGRWLAAGPA